MNRINVCQFCIFFVGMIIRIANAVRAPSAFRTKTVRFDHRIGNEWMDEWILMKEKIYNLLALFVNIYLGQLISVAHFCPLFFQKIKSDPTLDFKLFITFYYCIFSYSANCSSEWPLYSMVRLIFWMVNAEQKTKNKNKK